MAAAASGRRSVGRPTAAAVRVRATRRLHAKETAAGRGVAGAAAGCCASELRGQKPPAWRGCLVAAVADLDWSRTGLESGRPPCCCVAARVAAAALECALKLTSIETQHAPIQINT